MNVFTWDHLQAMEKVSASSTTENLTIMSDDTDLHIKYNWFYIINVNYFDELHNKV